jgi:hypothetical protein
MFSPSTKGSLASPSTGCSTPVIIIIIVRGWYSRPVLASLIVDSGPLHPKNGGGEQPMWCRLVGLVFIEASLGGVRQSTGHPAHCLAHCTGCSLMSVEQWVEVTLSGEPKYSGGTCLCVQRRSHMT